MQPADQWGDFAILEALEMRDRGYTYTQIGKRFGRTRNAVSGMFFRLDRHTDAHDPDGNQNGTMPARWWARD